MKCNFHGLTKVQNDENSKIKHIKKIDHRERNKLKETLRLGGKVLVLVQRLKKNIFQVDFKEHSKKLILFQKRTNLRSLEKGLR